MAYETGDSVRFIGSAELDLTRQKVYTVGSVGFGEFSFKDDVGDLRWRQMDDPEFELVSSDDELAQLRAWKASALVRFPDLAEPETDDEAADRIYDDYAHDKISGTDDAIRAAIAWARANPR